MVLDLVDRKILYYLDNDSRQSISKLAKRLRIGRNVALYRINRLKKEGIIKGSYVELNSAILGYLNFRIFFKLGNYSPKEYNELISFISSNKNLSWFAKVLGKWDLDIVFMTKKITDFDSFHEELFFKFNKIIESSEISILKEVIKYPRDFIISENNRSFVKPQILKWVDKPPYIPDSKDEDILKLLSSDASMNVVEIAEKTKLSINTVKKRIKNLKKSGIIAGYRLFIDTEKLGYRYYKIHVYLRNYSKKDLDSINDWLGVRSNMIYIDKYINGPELEIELNVREENDYIKFWDEFSKTFGKVIKDHFFINFYDVRTFRYLPEK